MIVVDTNVVTYLLLPLPKTASSHCRSYDCEFVGAAQHLGVPLVTEDRALLVACPAVAQSLHQATS